MRPFEVARLDELERIPVEHGLEWRPIRRRFGIAAFGTNAYTAANVGDWVVEEHSESTGHEELYLVVSGRARFTVDGEELDAPAGTIVFLGDPALQRGAIAEEPGTVVLAAGGKPGEPFAPSPWEWYFEAYAAEGAGDAERALAIMRDGLRELPDNASMLYHCACILARTGRLDEARADLRRAIELRPDLAERARSDDDLAEVREALG
ncbi:MAG: tetratricopeptide repeat protein [Gaiellaceae bacterium]